MEGGLFAEAALHDPPAVIVGCLNRATGAQQVQDFVEVTCRHCSDKRHLVGELVNQ